MKRFSSLGTFLAMTAMLGATAPRRLRTARDRFADRSQSLHHDLLTRAEAKRARKAAKLREHGL